MIFACQLRSSGLVGRRSLYRLPDIPCCCQGHSYRLWGVGVGEAVACGRSGSSLGRGCSEGQDDSVVEGRSKGSSESRLSRESLRGPDFELADMHRNETGRWRVTGTNLVNHIPNRHPPLARTNLRCAYKHTPALFALLVTSGEIHTLSTPADPSPCVIKVQSRRAQPNGSLAGRRAWLPLAFRLSHIPPIHSRCCYYPVQVHRDDTARRHCTGVTECVTPAVNSRRRQPGAHHGAPREPNPQRVRCIVSPSHDPAITGAWAR